jgi:hypothetical protein
MLGQNPRFHVEGCYCLDLICFMIHYCCQPDWPAGIWDEDMRGTVYHTSKQCCRCLVAADNWANCYLCYIMCCSCFLGFSCVHANCKKCHCRSRLIHLLFTYRPASIAMPGPLHDAFAKVATKGHPTGLHGNLAYKLRTKETFPMLDECISLHWHSWRFLQMITEFPWHVACVYLPSINMLHTATRCLCTPAYVVLE